jgi:hypothetical protein
MPRTRPVIVLVISAVLVTGLLGTVPAATGATSKVTSAVAFDVSPALRELAKHPVTVTEADAERGDDRGKLTIDARHTPDGALQQSTPATTIGPTIANFEGLAQDDNPVGVQPPDPNGEIGPRNYVEMVNIVFAIYSRTGKLQLGPLTLGTLWQGFAVPDCEEEAGDPVVLYDQLADRWILTQFTDAGPEFFNCVAVSTTGDPTGSYYRYAFSSGPNFPDYPKYGVWPNAYFLSTREFSPAGPFAGIGAYALERKAMLKGDPDAHVVSTLFPPGNAPYLTGDGLLPTDLDGKTPPPSGSPNYFVGTMDDDGPYGAPFDGINVFAFDVHFGAHPGGTFTLAAQLHVASFDSIFPCDASSARSCIPQPQTGNKLDVLSYRQRPLFRLAYRNFGSYASFVTNQAVEARPGIAGVRWYELRLQGGSFSVRQQGTFAPNDGVHRWMGSAAMDKNGGIGLGYSVSNATNVYPGIRYTGRLAGDPLGEMTLGEGTIVDGAGVQKNGGRWGDYTDMTVDPVDDCTFWYVDEYYSAAAKSNQDWQTRIASFRLPGCS